MALLLLSTDRTPESGLFKQVMESHDPNAQNRALNTTYLDLTVTTDARPFFFNMVRIFDVPRLVKVAGLFANRKLNSGVITGNLVATGALIIILFISTVAVIVTILVPLRSAARESQPNLVAAGSLYFSLIGMGFMLSEIALLQYFSVYLGHPIYSLGVCLFSLILASGIGSLTSDRLKLATRGKLMVWAV